MKKQDQEIGDELNDKEYFYKKRGIKKQGNIFFDEKVHENMRKLYHGIIWNRMIKHIIAEENRKKLEEELELRRKLTAGNTIEEIIFKENDEECFICLLEIEKGKCLMNTCCSKKVHIDFYTPIQNKKK